MTTYKVELVEGRSHYVMGLGDSEDLDTLLIHHYPDGDIDTRMKDVKMMEHALYDLYQCASGLQDGDVFETEFGDFVCEGVHVVPRKKNNTEFKVGDGVCWGFNGDTEPGTVIRTTRSRVYVQRDKATAKAPVAYGEQAEWTFEADPEGAVEVFTFRQPAAYRLMGMSRGWTLCHGRRKTFNYSF